MEGQTAVDRGAAAHDLAHRVLKTSSCSAPGERLCALRLGQTAGRQAKNRGDPLLLLAQRRAIALAEDGLHVPVVAAGHRSAAVEQLIRRHVRIIGPGLQQQDFPLPIFAEPRRDHGAGRAATDDNRVVLQR